MTEEELEKLRELDWVELAAKVANFARGRARARGLGTDALISGKSPEEIAWESVEFFWENPDRRPNTVSVYSFLCQRAKQVITNLKRSADARTRDNEPDVEAVATTEPSSAPDAVAARYDEFMTAINLLLEHPAVKGKPDHETVVTALGCGLLDCPEIAEETGLERDRVYQVQRELRSIYPQIAKELNFQKGAPHESK